MNNRYNIENFQGVPPANPHFMDFPRDSRRGVALALQRRRRFRLIANASLDAVLSPIQGVRHLRAGTFSRYSRAGSAL
jgi:hypothetical protein